MLKSLKYSVEFPSTGRAFRNQIEFAPGLTAIVGRNEAGKSLVIEMIAYALFGKSALRGAAADYKNLHVELCFDLFGEEVNIVRFPKSESLAFRNDILAVGAEAINRTVPQLLGFGLDVFNVALAAQQDELNEFTNMRPTARAKMVDDLTGMDRLEATERECKAEVKNLSLLADALTLQVSIPVEPVEPEGYLPYEVIESQFEAAWESENKRLTLLAVKRPEAPVPPEKPDIDLSEDELVLYESNRIKVEQEQLSLARELARIPEPTVSSETLRNAVAYAEYQDECQRRGPRPTHDAGTLKEYEKLWMQPESGECPNCGYSFTDHRAPLTLEEIRREFARIEAWAEPLEEVERCVIADLPAERIAHDRAPEAERLRHQFGSITVPVSRSRDLQRVRDYNVEFARYDERRQRYEADLATWQEAQEALQALPDLSKEVERLRDARVAAQRYESALRTFEAETAAYVRNMQQVSNKREEAEGFKAAAEALKLTRLEAKNELAPRLAATASALLYSLTAGERQTIVVDQDFNVWVDGQPLATLSGSGKAVVNLALRIGLGQVLTAKVLSLFIGDEIDGSMDQTRAGATHETFRALTKHVDQVILITHKEIDADNKITL